METWTSFVKVIYSVVQWEISILLNDCKLMTKEIKLINKENNKILLRTLLLLINVVNEISKWLKKDIIINKKQRIFLTYYNSSSLFLTEIDWN